MKRLRNLLLSFATLFTISCFYFSFRAGIQPRRSCVNDLELMSRELFDYMSFYLRNKPYPGPLNYTNYIIARRNVKPLLNVEPIIPDFVPVYNDVRAFNYSIQQPECPQSSKTSLFMAVISAPANFEKRKAIRETWLNELQSHLSSQDIELVGFAFVMGHSDVLMVKHQVLRENEINGDILQVDMTDTYYNLTLKLTGLLNWLDTYCSNINFVFKVDDDVYVNSRNLAWFIQQIRENEPSVYCSNNDGRIQRETSKWKISYEDFPWQSYPYYCEGAAIMIDGGAVRRLLASAQTIPYLKFDDIYYTGLVAPKAGISLMMGDRYS